MPTRSASSFTARTAPWGWRRAGAPAGPPRARGPVLGLGYDGGSVAQIIREADAGIVCNDPALIAAQLRRWIAQKAAQGIGPIEGPGPARFAREAQYAKLEAFLADLVG